jgi:chloramphenicol-sensitive protein RarD
MRHKLIGFALAMGTFSIWGLYPILWSILKQYGAQPMEILAHRIAWAHTFGLVALLLLKSYNTEQNMWPKKLRTWAICATSGALNVLNWVICIWAATSGHLIEASFGYFLAPLMAAGLGVLLFRERLGRLQVMAIGIACCAIVASCIVSGQWPWVAAAAATTAAGYAALRKYVQPQAIAGMLIETLFFVPFAAFFLLRLHVAGTGIFTQSWAATCACLIAGLATALAVMGYAGAATRLRLSTLGISQYIYPCAQFLLGVFFFHETLSMSSWVMLGGIIVALMIYSGATLQGFIASIQQQRRKAAERLRLARLNRKSAKVKPIVDASDAQAVDLKRAS